MHPIERLRHVARSSGAEPAALAREAAAALASFADDPPGLVTACRRLVDRHPTVGPVWWLAARVLVAGDPGREGLDASRALDEDTTARVLAADLPQEATVVVLGWGDVTSDALARRADVHPFVVDVDGYAHLLVDRLRAIGVDADAVHESGVGAATVGADLVLLEAAALGPTGFVAQGGSRAAAAVARHARIPIWVAAATGRVLPGRLWEALVSRLEVAGLPWEAPEEVVPADLVDRVAGPGGLTSFADAVARADCPVTPELLKSV